MAVVQETGMMGRIFRKDTDLGYSSVHNKIQEVESIVRDPEIGLLFRRCFPSAIKSTFHYFEDPQGKPFTHVTTGDIGKAMWIRDASGQAESYLDLANSNDNLRKAILGVINLETEFILRDPHANAFYLNENKVGIHRFDKTQMRRGVFERKWEPDTIGYYFSLAYKYWQKTNDSSFADERWAHATRLAVSTLEEQQRFDSPGPYSFERRTNKKTEQVPGDGWGVPTKKTGLIHSTHRPSDDACELPFHIPSNLFVAQTLGQVAQMHREISYIHDESFAQRCENLATTIEDKVSTHGIIDHPQFGPIFAYEIDGLGGYLLKDDASNPCLLSIPLYSNISRENQVYKNTRAFVLSSQNPNYFRGKLAEGVGSEHTGKDRICPSSVITRALTSTKDDEILDCLEILKRIHGGRYSMNESVSVHKATIRTRDWFPWPDSMFGSLVLTLQMERPYILASRLV